MTTFEELQLDSDDPMGYHGSDDMRGLIHGRGGSDLDPRDMLELA